MAKLLVMIAVLQQTATAPSLKESLWEAARTGDTARITAVLDKGIDIDAKAPYEMTALLFAADNGRLDAVKLLV
jgi:ankyrin repeat protein